MTTENLKSKSSKYICIRNAPLNWNLGTMKNKFSQYGPVEDVTIEPPYKDGHNSQVVIVEFECEEDAAAALEDLVSDYKVNFYSPHDTTRSSYVLLPRDEPATNSTPKFKLIHCSNSNCTGQLVADDTGRVSDIYCSPNCYFEMIDMTDRVNIYDKWIASMGRSGTGMLKEHEKLDKVIVTVDQEGNRSSKYFLKK